MSTELDQQQTNIEHKLSVALIYFRDALHLTEEEAIRLVKPFIKLVHLEENQSLFEEGNSDSPPALGVVVSGFLKLTQESPFSEPHLDDEYHDTWSAFIHQRELIGGLQVKKMYYFCYCSLCCFNRS